jgi:hypothetical protein
MTDLVGEHWKTYTNLAGAIVEVQIEDYKTSAKKINYILSKKEWTKYDYDILLRRFSTIKQATLFFKSDWCATLSIATGCDGRYILEKLEQEYPFDKQRVKKILNQIYGETKNDN